MNFNKFFLVAVLLVLPLSAVPAGAVEVRYIEPNRTVKVIKLPLNVKLVQPKSKSHKYEGGKHYKVVVARERNKIVLKPHKTSKLRKTRLVIIDAR